MLPVLWDSGRVRIDVLLDQLCVELGFCLAPDERERLIADPGTDVDDFTDRVIVAEEMDPLLIDGDLRRQIRQRVQAVLDPSSAPWTRDRRRR